MSKKTVMAEYPPSIVPPLMVTVLFSNEPIAIKHKTA